MSPLTKKILSIIAAISVIGLLFLFYIRAKKQPPENARILIIGNSITAYGNSYADQLQKQYPKFTISKMAMVGAKVDWMLGMINGISSPYDYVIIEGGTNDIYAGSDLENTKSELAEMYMKARNLGAKVVAMTVPPNNGYQGSVILPDGYASERTANLNNWIRNQKLSDFVVDFYGLLDDGSGYQQDIYNSGDRLHPNDAGQSALMNGIINEVF